MFISQAESIGFSEPDSERAPAELARRRRWPAMMSRNTLARAAAIGLIVIPAGVRPTAQTQATPPSVSRAAVSNAGSVVGSAWNADNSGIPGARLRLRNVSTGKIAASAIADQLGQFRFDAAPGSYLIELVDESTKLLAVGQVFTISQGETVATFVRLGTKLPWIAGFFSNAAAAAITAAAAEGVTALAPVARPVSRKQ
jgi:hypothetical protein